MKKITLFTIGYLLSVYFLLAQNRQMEILKKIEGTYYVESYGKDYPVNSSVVTVKLKSGVEQSKIALDTIRANKLGYIDIAVPIGLDLVEYLDSLKKSNDFEVVDYNTFGEFCSGFIPNDPHIYSQWYLDAINAFDAWNITMGSPSVKVAVIDAGPNWSHLDIGYGSDGYTNIDTSLFLDYDTNNKVPPSYEHGTRILGIIGAKTNNSEGIAGIAGGNGISSGVTIIPINIGDSNKTPDESVLDDAILYAVDSGARIIQLSLAFPNNYNDTLIISAIDAAIAYAVQHNVLIICASGNATGGDLWISVAYPASHPDVFAINAMEQNYEAWLRGGYGEDLDVIAPGVNIWSTTINNSYDSQKGTSFAAPMVSGIAALMLSVDSSLTAQQVRNIIEKTAQKIRTDIYIYTDTTPGRTNGTWNNKMGYGLVDAYAAVLLASRGKEEADLIIRDNQNDVGHEPNNTIDSVMWNSPDIWVRRLNDSGTIHQNPCPNTVNYIHIRVRNAGLDTTNGNEKVTLYWAKTDTAMSWPYHWQENTYNNGLLRGDTIGTFSINNGIRLTAGEAYTIVVPWHFPYLNDYAAISNEPELFSLLAKIEVNGDTLIYPETENIIGNVRNNNKIAMKNVSLKSIIDLMIKDDTQDKGDESYINFYSKSLDKPDIWVRHQPDNGLTHQHPIPGGVNYVYVRIKNIGCETSVGNDSLKLYWAKSDTNLLWPFSWAGNHFNGTGPLLGDYIGTYHIPVIPSYGDIVIEIPWQTPNPIDYLDIIDDPWYFFLLARIESETDTMTYQETFNVDSNVINNNNIAWKRVDIAGKIDLMIRDTEDDWGIEPNLIPDTILWNSPDIWVRRYADSVTEHQNPKPDTVNYIYVRVKNIGNTFSRGNEQLELYLAKGNTNLSWTSNWTKIITNIYDSRVVVDSIISYDIPNILTGQETIVEIPWEVPNLAKSDSITVDAWHLYLLARIVSENDTMTFLETTNIDSNIKNNNNIASKSTWVGKVDLRIRDNSTDAGTEPNPYTGSMEDSPDIWIRHAQDSGLIHQNPIPNQTNYAYVRIKNIGTAPSQGNDVLKLYWAKAGTNLAWDSCWNGNHFPQNGSLMGDFIDSISIPVIPCKGEITLVVPWNTPNPNDNCGTGNDSNLYQFYLLARIESELDTMTASETTNINNNVKNNNNIAMKSVNFIRRDLIIRDTESDTGIEPNTSAIVSDSPDIWVRRNIDTNTTHQNPITNWVNRVYVRIKNTGCIASQRTEVLKLYWAKVDTSSLSWPNHWDGSNSLLGNFIGSKVIPSISPNGETIMQIDWIAPNPANYYGISTDPWQFSLLARIEDTVNIVTALETEDFENNVRNNKNIARKNVTVGNIIDLMIRDDYADSGIEPNPSNGNLWNSPDIWARRQYENFPPDTIHQYLIPNSITNTIYVRIKNRGNRPYYPQDSAEIFLYWEKDVANTNDWRYWHPIENVHINVKIEPGEEQYVEFLWKPTPDPDTFSNTANPSLFYLLVRIDYKEDTINNISNKVLTTIKNNNNFAGKSVYIYHIDGDVDGDVDLWIKDIEEDTGETGIIYSGSLDKSPDIWVRNSNDGFANQVHEKPEYDAFSSVYVYVRVRNRGNNSLSLKSPGYLALYWTKAASASSWPENWDGTNPLIGNLIGRIPLSDVHIPNGRSQIFEFRWNILNPNIFENWNTCLLARIEYLDEDPITEASTLWETVYYNNNIALHNVIVVNNLPDSRPIIEGEAYYMGSYMYIGNSFERVVSFNFNFGVPDDESPTVITERAEVRIITDDVGWSILYPALVEHPSITIVREREFAITESNVTLENIYFEAGVRIPIYVGFQFNDEENNTEETFHYRVSQEYSSTNMPVGAVHFIINKYPSEEHFTANAGEDIYADRGETVVLSAEDVGEEAIYKWYSENGEFLHEGMEFVVEVTAAKKYTLEVTALSDGYKAYDEVEVKLNPSRLVSIYPNPATNQITVTYNLNNVMDAYVTLRHFYFLIFISPYTLDLSTNSITIDMQSFPSGSYVISLFCDVENPEDVEPVDTKTFVKY